MENNKPEWLLKAEEELAKFAKTKIGKMNQKEFDLYERQSNSGKSGGAAAKKSGQLLAAAKNGGKKQGPIQGKKNVESGHLAFITPKKGTEEALIRGRKSAATAKARGSKPYKVIHCDACNKTVTSGVAKRHGSNCFAKKAYDMFPNETLKISSIVKLFNGIYGYNTIKKIVSNTPYLFESPKKGYYKKVLKQS
jgi:hypothetical protein